MTNQSIEKVYLDVDGVILTRDGKQMPSLKEFLTAFFDLVGDQVYWLTTHCRDGSTDNVLAYLKKGIDEDIYLMLERIKPAKWNTLKTEAIDLNSEFLWFDDVIFQSEYRVLEKAGKEYCLIKVENNLEELVKIIQ
jgi:hypothetical protein